ncbi:MAG TPA: FmdB family zinc ribbon protein [Candidatus Acidoferrum sp.]
MPLYEYECEKCHRRTEKIENVNGPHLKKCPQCGGKVERLVSSSAIQFKGSGWYVTDYAGKKSSSTESVAAGKSDSKDSSGDKDSSSKDSSKDSSAKESTSKSSSKESTSSSDSKDKKPARKKD